LRLQKEIIQSGDYDMLVGFPDPKSEGVQLGAGFQSLGNLTRYFKILKSERILQKEA